MVSNSIYENSSLVEAKALLELSIVLITPIEHLDGQEKRLVTTSVWIWTVRSEPNHARLLLL